MVGMFSARTPRVRAIPQGRYSSPRHHGLVSSWFVRCIGVFGDTSLFRVGTPTGPKWGPSSLSVPTGPKWGPSSLSVGDPIRSDRPRGGADVPRPMTAETTGACLHLPRRPNVDDELYPRPQAHGAFSPESRKAGPTLLVNPNQDLVLLTLRRTEVSEIGIRHTTTGESADSCGLAPTALGVAPEL